MHKFGSVVGMVRMMFYVVVGGLGLGLGTHGCFVLGVLKRFFLGGYIGF